MLNDLGEIYPNIGCLDADRLSLLLDIRQKLCAVEQALGGNAADIQAGSAEMLLFHQRYACPQLGSPDGGDIAAGTASNNSNFHDMYSSAIKPKSSPDARCNTGCP
ncbi:Uncharacterised protein [uncultured Blautia sp.]|nr:Uncharacterised protein [uncultured Blautia sp.]